MFQFAQRNVQLMHTTVTILGIYRPPAGSVVEFLTEYTNWITDIVVQDTNLLLAGDFTLYINNKDDDNSANFKESIVTLGFIQHVAIPNHKSGNILNLILMESFSEINIYSCILSCLWSDHYMINCKTSLRHQEICHRDINYCDLVSIDMQLMAADIKLDITDEDTLDILVKKLK